MPKPVIPAGDLIQRSKGWKVRRVKRSSRGGLKRIFGWFRGLVVHAGPVDVQLTEKPRITPPPTWGPHK